VILEFTIFGVPVPKARARVVKGRAFTPQRTRDYETSVRTAALAAVVRDGGWPRFSPDARFKVEADIYRVANRGDLTNYEKSIEDGCNTIIWKDDRQIVEKHTRMFVDKKNPRVEVRVEVLS
jgi:Holliday junction resolvase RusA-like endonuclease